jgi:hypothetical protein
LTLYISAHLNRKKLGAAYVFHAYVLVSFDPAFQRVIPPYEYVDINYYLLV